MSINLVRPTLKHKENALEFKKEFFEHGENVINGSEMLDNMDSYDNWLSKLIKNKTVLIIAHRMRTIANADKIVVLKDGVVAESGKPEYSKEIGGIYSHMIQLQNVSENWKMA